MTINLGEEPGFQISPQAWEAAGQFLLTAKQDIARELGGEDLVERITLAAISDDVLPNPAALIILEDIAPGSAKRVMSRAEEIQRETHQRELDVLHQQRFRRFGRGLLDGFASINILGIPPRKRG